MPRVRFKSVDYDVDRLKAAMEDFLAMVPAGRIGTGSRVLLKPNLLLPAKPEQGVLTHPALVRAVAELLLDAGAKVRLSDSPATGAFARILRVGGYDRALAGLDVDCRPFETAVQHDIGPPYGRIEMARAALEADAVVNLAKLKTHSQMVLTLGVKNLFGCILGLAKPQWHLRSGVDRDVFARLLVQIHYAVDPVLTIVDGILALEGEGPGKGGTPRTLGVLAGGTDAASVDWAICRLLGLSPERLPTHRAAVSLGRFSAQPRMEGTAGTVTGFRFPDQTPLLFGPAFFQGALRRHVVQRPVVDPLRCRVCGECWKICPADAVAPSGEKVAFDYQRCIRCYCCVEVCPHGALSSRTPLVGTILHRIGLLK